jgi:hypothetical protein
VLKRETAPSALAAVNLKNLMRVSVNIEILLRAPIERN